MWPEWESTSVAEEKLTMRHLWVELLSLSQLHKIHYSLRWSPNAINKKRWEKAAAVEVCRIAPAPGCPISQRFAERVAEGWPTGQCLLQLHVAAGLCTPKPQTVQMGANIWPRWWQSRALTSQQPLLGTAAGTPDTFKSSIHWDGTDVKTLSGNREGRDAVPSPNISFGKYLG